MKKKSLVFAIALIAYVVSCSLPDSGCDDYSCFECIPVFRKHSGYMGFYVNVTCLLGEECTAEFFYSYVSGVGNRRAYPCYDDFQYEFIGDTIETSMSTGSNVKLPLKDNHIQFSLFDVNRVEKKYDIDLSEIITNSYRFVNDSLEITIPDYVSSVRIYKGGPGYRQLESNWFVNGKYTFLPDSLDKLYFYYEQIYPNPLGTDFFYLNVYIDCERKEESFVCKD